MALFLFLLVSMLVSNVLGTMAPAPPTLSYHDMYMRSGGGPFKLRHDSGLCVSYDHVSKLLVLARKCSLAMLLSSDGGLKFVDWCIIPVPPSSSSSTATLLMVSDQCSRSYTLEQLCMQPQTESYNPSPGVKVVSDCSRFPSISPEFTCFSRRTGLHLNLETWPESSCINCTCGLFGTAYCIQKYSKVGHKDIIADSCFDCDFNQFSSSKKCLSYDLNLSLRTIMKNIPVNISECIECRLKGNTISCLVHGMANVSMEFQQLARFFPNILIDCDKQNHTCIDNILSDYSCSQDCSINGVLLKHGEVRSFTFANVPRCVTCRCLHGVPQCRGSWMNSAIDTCAYMTNSEQCVNNIESCTSTTKCKYFFEIAQKVCLYPGNIKCDASYSWTANGCQYFCTEAGLEYTIIQKPWCQKLVQSNYCAMCGNKTKFLTQFSSLFTSCNISGEVVRNVEICDGEVDCLDGTDEHNCTEYFCQPTHTFIYNKNFYWPRSLVNETIQINCSSVVASWIGVAKRTCQMKKGRRAAFTKVDYCSCMDARPDFTIFLSNETAGLKEELSKAALNLLIYMEQALTSSKYIQAAHRLMVLSQSTDYMSLFFFKRMRRIFEHETPCLQDDKKNASRWDSILKNIPAAKKGHTGLTFISSYKQLLISKLSIITKIQARSKANAVAVKSTTTTSNVLSESPVIARRSTVKKAPINQNIEYSSVNINETVSNNHTNLTNTNNNRSVLVVKTTPGSGHKLARQRERIKEIQQELHHINVTTKIEIVLGSISVLSCIISLIMYRVLRVEHNTKFFLHKNLFATWIFTYGMYIIGIALGTTLQEKKDICTAYLIICHYNALSFFSWMLFEGLNLLVVLIVVFGSRKRRHFLYAISGWGIPLCITILEVSIFHKDFRANKSCVGLEKNVWLFKGPAAFLLGVNCILFFSIFFILVKSVCKSSRYSTTSEKSRATGKSFIVLLPLTGITYLLGFAATNIVVLYIYTILNSLMGLMLAIFHFALDSTVQTAYWNYRRKGQVASSSAPSTKQVSSVGKPEIHADTAL